MVSRHTQKDVGKFESKLIGPFTTRQTIFVGAAAVVDLLLYNILGVFGLDQASRIGVCAIISIPLIACGYVKPYGMKMEEFIYQYYIYKICAPPIRKYETHTWLDDYKEELSPKEQKEQEKKKKKMENHREIRGYKSYL